MRVSEEKHSELTFISAHFDGQHWEILIFKEKWEKCLFYTESFSNFINVKTHLNYKWSSFVDVLAAASWSSTCLICNLSGFSSYITPHPPHRALRGVFAWRPSVSHCFPPPPPRCSSTPLFPLIVFLSVNADSPLVEVTRPPVKRHPPHTPPGSGRGEKELTSARGGGPAADRWTAAQGEKLQARSGILEGKGDKRRGGDEEGRPRWMYVGVKERKEEVNWVQWHILTTRLSVHSHMMWGFRASKLKVKQLGIEFINHHHQECLN